MNAPSALRALILRDVRAHSRSNHASSPQPYTAGDDFRSIDWNSTARTGELFTKTPQLEKHLTLASIVDTSPSMHVGTTRPLSLAAAEAAELWHRACSPEDQRVSIPSGDIASCIAFACGKLAKGSALLLVSDCFGPPGNVLAAGRQFACTLLLARDPWHDGIPLRGFHRIRDVETGVFRRVYFGSAERSRHREAVRERKNTIVARFSAAGWRTGILTEQNGADALLAAFTSG